MQPGPLLPLLDRPLRAPMFHGPHGPVSAGAFLGDAQALADALPAGRFLVNLCRERYTFAVAFAAGLIAGRTTLLNADPAGLGALAAAYPGCTALIDTPHDLPIPATFVAPIVVPGSVVPGSVSPGSGDPAATIPASHIAAVVFTSGSTGAPVPHPKPWGALVACTRAAAARFGFTNAGAPATILGTVPPQHMYGLETTVLLPFHAPAASWCGPAFFPGDIAQALGATPAPHTLVTTPLQLRNMLTGGVAMPGLRAVISATAPLAPDLAATAEAAWATEVHEIFGATECGSIASRRTTDGPTWFPYPGTTLRIAPDGATVQAPGAAPIVLADLLEAAPGGFSLLGRRTDVVKLGGRRASLPGLNQVLAGLDGVQDAAFVVPDDLDQRSNARLVAVVVAPGRTTASILAELRRHIDAVFLPRRVIHVDALPRNAMGKLPRQALLDLVAHAA